MISTAFITRRESHIGKTIQPHLVPKWPQVDFKLPTWNQNDLTWLGKKVTDFWLKVDLWHVKQAKKLEEIQLMVLFILALVFSYNDYDF